MAHGYGGLRTGELARYFARLGRRGAAAEPARSWCGPIAHRFRTGSGFNNQRA
ncbi:hypothetical protein LC55x_3869 [Lysobacter capsici]|uniref:Uncharacterized protein n=1 Tax=Lysobacter capsici AZ78 TaxID=1444315 RepID=A0A108UDD8_9GAMM|nr:hypothetical protein LC55x_3869 [Lysobacter capsici]KWS07082.1 hypothetical protein AZ78_4642 [Lysobacter capsici AZ78]